MSARAVFRLVALACTTVVACVGEVGTGGSEADNASDGTSPPQGGRSAGVAGPGAGSGASMSPVAPGSPPGGVAPQARSGGRPVVRLLARQELKNALEDLFGAPLVDADLPYADFTLTSLASPPSDFINATDFDKLDRLTYALAQSFVGKMQVGSGKCVEGAAGQIAGCVDAFLSAQGRRIFRRPLTAADLESSRRVYVAERTRKGHEAGLVLALQAFLHAPQFLYRSEIGEAVPGVAGLSRLTDFEYASALSFLLVRSTPDNALLDATATGGLRTVDGVRAQVRRLLGSRRGQEGVLDFYMRWMGVADFDEIEKDQKLFTMWDPAFRAAAKRELVEVLKREVLTSSSSSSSMTGGFKNLLLTRRGFADSRLASIYKVTAPATTGGGPVELDAGTRAGLFTQAAFLIATSKENDTNPMHAGKVMFDQVLCQPFPPIPENPFLIPFSPDASKSRRQNMEARTAGGACAACHTLLNPVSFVYEAFDPVGRHRTKLDGFDVDTRGELRGTRDANGPFANAVELMQNLAKSAQVTECHARQWLRYALGRQEETDDDASLTRAHDAFARAGFDVLTMVTELVLSEAFVYRKRS